LASERELPAKFTRNLCFHWIERELGGLNPTPEQRRKTIALATQMRADYKAIVAMEHCRRLDYILDRMTEFLCPEEWAANERKLAAQARRDVDYHLGQSEVFAAIYSGDVATLRELGIDEACLEPLGGWQPKRDLV
jgi:hypothetical protein